MKKLILFFLFIASAQLSQAQWEPDVRLTDTYDTSFLSHYGSGHCIAASGDTVHVVWSEKIDETMDIFYKRSTDGGINWELEKRLSFTEERSYYPSVTVSGQSVYVIWTELFVGYLEVFFIKSMDGGENWGEISNLTDNQQIASNPVIASSVSNVHVAWVIYSPDMQSSTVYHITSNNEGENWSNETWISPNTIYAVNPSITVNGPEVHIAWIDMRDGNREIYYRNSADNGHTWGAETRLTNDPGPSYYPSIAVSGNVVSIAWSDLRNGNVNIFFKTSNDGGEYWGEDTQVTYYPLQSYCPNLTLSDSAVHLIWRDSWSGISNIFYSYSVDGGISWAKETRLNDISSNSAQPFIAVSGPLLHAIWVDYRDLNYELYYKRNSTGGFPVAIKEIDEAGSPFVYPNPASRQLTVRQSSVDSRQSLVNLSIVDLYGREVKEIGDISSFPCQVDISSLQDGVYFLRIDDLEGSLNSVRFLKISE